MEEYNTKRGRAKKLTADQIKQLVKDYKDQNIYALAVKYSVSPPTIRKYVLQHTSNKQHELVTDLSLIVHQDGLVVNGVVYYHQDYLKKELIKQREGFKPERTFESLSDLNKALEEINDRLNSRLTIKNDFI